MAKYKVGDKVRIVSERPDDPCFTDGMRRFLGNEITISVVREPDGVPFYYSEDAQYTGTVQKFLADNFGIPGYYFKDEWISGLAGPKNHEFSVSVRFHDRLTVAELMKDGKTVKVANARCNPKDTYDRGEGAKVAVNRLFEKKKQQDSIIGKKFKVIGKSGDVIHFFRIGTVVKVVDMSKHGNYMCKALSYSPGVDLQFVSPKDLEPYEEAKK